MRTTLIAAVLPLFLAGLFIGSAASPSATAAPGKNLQVYPKDTDTKAIKADMKVIAKALGVQCDYCHDMDAMDKDTDLKKRAREMMKMVGAINAQLKKSGFKQEVGCVTCHGGQKKPKAP
jgi:cytochrome c551/c552